MRTWTEQELEAIGEADELQIASSRPDGTLRPFVTIWVVRVGEDLFIRAAHGPDTPWYRRARDSGEGRIRAGGMERDVLFGDALSELQSAVDTAYHTKYDRYGARFVNPVVGPDVAALTIRLLPAD